MLSFKVRSSLLDGADPDFVTSALELVQSTARSLIIIGPENWTTC
jgi:hypothetical protein